MVSPAILVWRGSSFHYPFSPFTLFTPFSLYPIPASAASLPENRHYCNFIRLWLESVAAFGSVIFYLTPSLGLRNTVCSSSQPLAATVTFFYPPSAAIPSGLKLSHRGYSKINHISCLFRLVDKNIPLRYYGFTKSKRLKFFAIFSALPYIVQ